MPKKLYAWLVQPPEEEDATDDELFSFIEKAGEIPSGSRHLHVRGDEEEYVFDRTLPYNAWNSAKPGDRIFVVLGDETP